MVKVNREPVPAQVTTTPLLDRIAARQGQDELNRLWENAQTAATNTQPVERRAPSGPLTTRIAAARAEQS